MAWSSRGALNLQNSDIIKNIREGDKMKFKKFKCFSMVLLIPLMFGTQVFASETAASEKVASETANSDEISQKSYAEKNYDNIQMDSEPVDESNINKDKDKDGQLTYFKEVVLLQSFPKNLF